jgi:hypothetical protein
MEGLDSNWVSRLGPKPEAADEAMSRTEVGGGGGVGTLMGDASSETDWNEETANRDPSLVLS